MDLSSITNHVNETFITVTAGLAAIYLGFKKTLKAGSKEELDTVKTNAEKDVILLISERLKTLEMVNQKLTDELEQIRREYVNSQIQNTELKSEIQNLKLFIEQQFMPRV